MHVQKKPASAWSAPQWAVAALSLCERSFAARHSDSLTLLPHQDTLSSPSTVETLVGDGANDTARARDKAELFGPVVNIGRKLARRTQPPPIEVVVAHYQEDLGWLADFEPHTRIYHKSGWLDDQGGGGWLWRESLTNIGMESHTYLSHLARRYHSLAELTLFTQAGVDKAVDHFESIATMVEQALNPGADVITWRMPTVFRRWDGMIHTYKWLDDYNSGAMRHAGMSPAEFWRFVFGPDAPEVPKQVNYIHEATFAVHRHAVHRRPQEFYARLLAYFEGINHPNPEEGHYMERLWLPIFAGAGGAVYMPGGINIPIYPADDQVTFPDDVRDGVWTGYPT